MKRPVRWAWAHVRSNTVAYVALFFALSSGAVAASQITGRQIADNAITSRKIANNTVRSEDVRNGTLRGRDVARNTLTGREIAESKLGRVPDASRLAGQTLAQVRSGIDAATLGGQTLAQVRSGIDASRLAGQTLAQVRSGIDAATLGGLAAGDFARQRSAFKSDEVSFGGTAFVAKAGSSVTVDVPVSGLVAVFASADLRVGAAPTNAATVGLFVDGNLAPGLPDCGGGGGGLRRKRARHPLTRGQQQEAELGVTLPEPPRGFRAGGLQRPDERVDFSHLRDQCRGLSAETRLARPGATARG